MDKELNDDKIINLTGYVINLNDNINKLEENKKNINNNLFNIKNDWIKLKKSYKVSNKDNIIKRISQFTIKDMIKHKNSIKKSLFETNNTKNKKFEKQDTFSLEKKINEYDSSYVNDLIKDIENNILEDNLLDSINKFKFLKEIKILDKKLILNMDNYLTYLNLEIKFINFLKEMLKFQNIKNLKIKEIEYFKIISSINEININMNISILIIDYIYFKYFKKFYKNIIFKNKNFTNFIWTKIKEFCNKLLDVIKILEANIDFDQWVIINKICFSEINNFLIILKDLIIKNYNEFEDLDSLNDVIKLEFSNFEIEGIGVNFLVSEYLLSIESNI